MNKLPLEIIHNYPQLAVEEHNFLLSFAAHHYRHLTISDVNWWNKSHVGTHDVSKYRPLSSPNDILIKSKKRSDDIAQFILEKFYNYTLYGNNDKNPFNCIKSYLEAVYLDKWNNIDNENTENEINFFLKDLEPALGAKIKYFVYNWMEEDMKNLKKEIFEREMNNV